MRIFSIQDPLDFLASFKFESRNAKKSILIQVMNFDPGKYIDDVVDILVEAANRGLDVRVNVDWLAERFFDGKFDFFYFKNNQNVAGFNVKRQQMYELLKIAGVKLTVTNRPNFFSTIFPAYGRNHIKMFVVDKETAWVGGVNLMNHSFENLDFMVRIDDQVIVRELIQQFPLVNELKRKSDYFVECADKVRFIVDSGKNNNSLIYSRAIELVKKAKKDVLFVSQFPPDGKLLKKIINVSKTGVKVTIITSNKTDSVFTTFPQIILYKVFIAKIKNNPNINLIHFTKKVHVKLLLVDETEVMFGSHNFSALGGFFQTEEIALHLSSKLVAEQFVWFLKKHVNF